MKNYRRFLYSTLETRFKTIMIGSLARVEQYFGYLWGHGEEELTDKQKEFRELWEELRTEILNHGNFQIRKGLDEVDEIMDANDNRYEYKFIMNNHRRER